MNIPPSSIDNFSKNIDQLTSKIDQTGKDLQKQNAIVITSRDEKGNVVAEAKPYGNRFSMILAFLKGKLLRPGKNYFMGDSGKEQLVMQLKDEFTQISNQFQNIKIDKKFAGDYKINKASIDQKFKDEFKVLDEKVNDLGFKLNKKNINLTTDLKSKADNVSKQWNLTQEHINDYLEVENGFSELSNIKFDDEENKVPDPKTLLDMMKRAEKLLDGLSKKINNIKKFISDDDFNNCQNKIQIYQSEMSKKSISLLNEFSGKVGSNIGKTFPGEKPSFDNFFRTVRKEMEGITNLKNLAAEVSSKENIPEECKNEKIQEKFTKAGLTEFQKLSDMMKKSINEASTAEQLKPIIEKYREVLTGIDGLKEQAPQLQHTLLEEGKTIGVLLQNKLNEYGKSLKSNLEEKKAVIDLQNSGQLKNKEIEKERAEELENQIKSLESLHLDTSYQAVKKNAELLKQLLEYQKMNIPNDEIPNDQKRKELFDSINQLAKELKYPVNLKNGLQIFANQLAEKVNALASKEMSAEYKTTQLEVDNYESKIKTPADVGVLKAKEEALKKESETTHRAWCTVLEKTLSDEIGVFESRSIENPVVVDNLKTFIDQLKSLPSALNEKDGLETFFRKAHSIEIELNEDLQKAGLEKMEILKKCFEKFNEGLDPSQKKELQEFFTKAKREKLPSNTNPYFEFYESLQNYTNYTTKKVQKEIEDISSQIKLANKQIEKWSKEQAKTSQTLLLELRSHTVIKNIEEFTGKPKNSLLSEGNIRDSMEDIRNYIKNLENPSLADKTKQMLSKPKVDKKNLIELAKYLFENLNKVLELQIYERNKERLKNWEQAKNALIIGAEAAKNVASTLEERGKVVQTDREIAKLELEKNEIEAKLAKIEELKNQIPPIPEMVA